MRRGGRRARAFGRVVGAVAAAIVIAVPATGRAQEPVATGAAVPVDTGTTFIAIDYMNARFVEAVAPWQLASLSFGRRSARGTFLVRANAARRFEVNGVQTEAEAYPRLGRALYAYVGAGYSDAPIFPEWRYGAELFANLPRAWEASIGARQLRVDGPPVTLFTGSVGRYVGNSWLSLRPWMRAKEGELSASLGLTGRKYFAHADNWVGFRASYGTTPTDRLTPNELVVRASSWSAALQGARLLRPQLAGTASLGWEREGLGRGAERRRVELSVGVRADLR